MSDTAFVCNMEAIPSAERGQHEETARQMFRRVHTVEELPDGFTFRMPGDDDMFRTTTTFVRNERLCCPFFSFVIVSEADGAGLTLTMKGPPGVKAVLKEELGEFVQLPA